VTRSHTEAPATQEAQRIAERALMLLGRTDAGRRSVRLLGVGVHGLSSTENAPAPALLPLDA
jgi:nucleotidyltransferase/DNA polymerase involved in DNA repair